MIVYVNVVVYQRLTLPSRPENTDITAEDSVKAEEFESISEFIS